jgi:hypothetical protein
MLRRVQEVSQGSMLMLMTCASRAHKGWVAEGIRSLGMGSAV